MADLSKCQFIYVPRGQANEYAPLAANPYRGCGHGCAYCSVPATIHMPRREFDMGAVLRPNFKAGLLHDAKLYQQAGITEQVMLSFTTDPYHAGDTSATRWTLETLIEHGLGFCTLTKGGTRALRDLDLFRRERDAFATTLTALDPDLSLRWERHAPLPKDRIAAIKAFHAAGIFTIVSLEPVISPEASLAIIEATHSFVDLFKCGRINYVPSLTKLIDWQDYTLRLLDRLHRLSAAAYFKEDLQPYLPAGYPNPMRLAQHHGRRP